jgi:hypothetical protein
VPQARGGSPGNNNSFIICILIYTFYKQKCHRQRAGNNNSRGKKKLCHSPLRFLHDSYLWVMCYMSVALYPLPSAVGDSSSNMDSSSNKIIIASRFRLIS